MLKSQETILEIDLSALKHNVTFIKSKLKSNTKFLAVVKAYAYGSDATEIAKYLEDLNVEDPTIQLASHDQIYNDDPTHVSGISQDQIDLEKSRDRENTKKSVATPAE